MSWCRLLSSHSKSSRRCITTRQMISPDRKYDDADKSPYSCCRGLFLCFLRMNTLVTTCSRSTNDVLTFQPIGPWYSGRRKPPGTDRNQMYPHQLLCYRFARQQLSKLLLAFCYTFTASRYTISSLCIPTVRRTSRH